MYSSLKPWSVALSLDIVTTFFARPLTCDPVILKCHCIVSYWGGQHRELIWDRKSWPEEKERGQWGPIDIYLNKPIKIKGKDKSWRSAKSPSYLGFLLSPCLSFFFSSQKQNSWSVRDIWNTSGIRFLPRLALYSRLVTGGEHKSTDEMKRKTNEMKEKWEEANLKQS